MEAVAAATPAVRPITYLVPQTDVRFLGEIARRMGWERAASPKTASKPKAKSVAKKRGTISFDDGKSFEWGSPEFIAYIEGEAAKARREMEAGETIVLRSHKDIDAYFDSL